MEDAASGSKETRQEKITTKRGGDIIDKDTAAPFLLRDLPPSHCIRKMEIIIFPLT